MNTFKPQVFFKFRKKSKLGCAAIFYSWNPLQGGPGVNLSRWAYTLASNPLRLPTCRGISMIIARPARLFVYVCVFMCARTNILALSLAPCFLALSLFFPVVLVLRCQLALEAKTTSFTVAQYTSRQGDGLHTHTFVWKGHSGREGARGAPSACQCSQCPSSLARFRSLFTERRQNTSPCCVDK